MTTIYIVSLESLPNRYTVEWLEGIPTALRVHAKQNNVMVDVVNIVGDDKEQLTTPGAFINFAGTNKWKSEQSIQIAKLIANGDIKDGDKFLFTDAWNPVILQTKYMLDLLNIKAEMYGIWHAGSYDKMDFLGRLIKDKRWTRSTEEAIFWALDRNLFATKFHKNLFHNGVVPHVSYDEFDDKTLISGQPHDELLKHFETLQAYCQPDDKKDIILFPHRIAPEKQHDIFLDLKASMPEYEFITCQEQSLTKEQYHELLCQSKLTFSANLQETFGISSCLEAPMLNNISLVPNRLSYTEIFEGFNDCLYPSEWTESFDSYLKYKDELIKKIRHLMFNYKPVAQYFCKGFKGSRLHEYAKAYVMYNKLLGL
jgi:glycosyltransferase involved in cell wall biosynthesis